MKKRIKLGYEIGSGEKIFIKPSHLIVTGVTQNSGKTTTIEALLERSKGRCIVFKTKPGEASFASQVPMPAYLAQKCNFEYVRLLLESISGDRLQKDERAELIKICSKCTSLQDIYKHVELQLTNDKIKGYKENIFVLLQHNLKTVLESLENVVLTPQLTIEEGINVIDLVDTSETVQALVIESVVSEVLKNHTDTIIVLPEMWRFISQKRGSPCKRAVETLMRQGAARSNFVFGDSQDLAGVDKTALKQVSTWCCLPEEMIRTHTGYSKISNLKVGDRVLTHEGIFRKVTKVLSRKFKGNLLKIKTYGNYHDICVTSEHPILTQQHYPRGLTYYDNSTHKLKDGTIKRYRYKRNIIDEGATWITAQELDTDKLLLYPVLKTRIPIPKNLPTNYSSEDMMNIIGFYLAEGYRDGKYITSFAFGKCRRKRLRADRVKKSAENLGISGKIDYLKSGGRLRLHSKQLMEFIVYHFGTGAKNKRIPSWIYSLDKKYLRTLLKSYTDGDGHKLKISNFRYKISTVSEYLALGLRELCLLCGYPASLFIARKAGTVPLSFSHKPSKLQTLYCLQYDTNPKRFGKKAYKGRVGIDDTYAYYRIRSIKKKKYSGKVYNIEVEKSESYCTKSFVVHNCLGFQTERNEVKHTIDQIPLPKRKLPQPDVIMKLDIGHFIVVSERKVRKVYVQPIWMSDKDARAIARGKKTIDEIEMPDPISTREVLKADRPPEDSATSTYETRSSHDITDDWIKTFVAFRDNMIQRMNGLAHDVERLKKLPTQNVDIDTVARKVARQLPRGATDVQYSVAPLEAIKKRFLKDAKDKILADISTLSDQEKQVLKYLEAAGRDVSNTEVVKKCFMLKQGGSSTSRVSQIFRVLESTGVAEKTDGKRERSMLRQRIAFLLEGHTDNESDIDQVYNHILQEML